MSRVWGSEKLFLVDSVCKIIYNVNINIKDGVKMYYDTYWIIDKRR